MSMVQSGMTVTSRHSVSQNDCLPRHCSLSIVMTTCAGDPQSACRMYVEQLKVTMQVRQTSMPRPPVPSMEKGAECESEGGRGDRRPDLYGMLPPSRPFARFMDSVRSDHASES